jgi:hypothetical protein
MFDLAMALGHGMTPPGAPAGCLPPAPATHAAAAGFCACSTLIRTSSSHALCHAVLGCDQTRDWLQFRSMSRSPLLPAVGVPADLARLLSFLDAQGMDACAALLPAAEDASAVLAALVPGAPAVAGQGCATKARPTPAKLLLTPREQMLPVRRAVVVMRCDACCTAGSLWCGACTHAHMHTCAHSPRVHMRSLPACAKLLITAMGKAARASPTLSSCVPGWCRRCWCRARPPRVPPAQQSAQP